MMSPRAHRASQLVLAGLLMMLIAVAVGRIQGLTLDTVPLQVHIEPSQVHIEPLQVHIEPLQVHPSGGSQ